MTNDVQILIIHHHTPSDRPVFQAEIRDALKIAEISCDEGSAVFQRDRCDTQILARHPQFERFQLL
jgi:hypothetical protein